MKMSFQKKLHFAFKGHEKRRFEEIFENLTIEPLQ